MFNIFEDLKWWQKLLLIIALPFVCVWESLNNWVFYRKKKK